MIFFTADSHFFHSNILKYCNRPFANLEEMHWKLIQNWNSVVSQYDEVYHLGDFFLHTTQKEALSIRNQLNGNIFLIEGNHDKVAKSIPQAFGWIKQMYRLNVKECKLNIQLCHYAMRTWSGSHKGSWQLYGHSHATLPEDPSLLSFDVGVDVPEWNFTPVSLDQVMKKMHLKKKAKA